MNLGDTRERALDLFGTPDEEYTFAEKNLGPCKHTEVHWNDPKHDDGWGVFVYLNNSRIYQIMSDTPRFATAGGVTSDSLPDEVQRLFPNLQSYVLLGSGSKVNGGENLVYWVDQSAGIAFEFYHHPKLNKRRLASTIVFEPGGEFFADRLYFAAARVAEARAFLLGILRRLSYPKNSGQPPATGKFRPQDLKCR